MHVPSQRLQDLRLSMDSDYLTTHELLHREKRLEKFNFALSQKVKQFEGGSFQMYRYKKYSYTDHLPPS